MITATATSPFDPSQQYIRAFSLLVVGPGGQTLDLSNLRVKFSVKQTTVETPNAADIRVYNLTRETALQVQSVYKQVIIQAGYQGNYGVVFKGNIKQVILGRENATDTFIDIVAGDGDLAYNYAIVNSTLAANSTQQAQINCCLKSLASLGVTAGGNSFVSATPTLPRGKVLFGNARNYVRDVAQTTQNSWSIQNGKLVLVPLKQYLPGQAVLLTSKTGMVGTPEQTNEGVNVKCIINPKIQISGRIQLDNTTVQRLRISLTLTPGNATNTAAPLPSNGVYFVLAKEITGDTRGTDWYTKLICLYIDSSTVFVNSVGNSP